MDQARDYPDGLAERHVEQQRPGWNWLSLLLLGLVMAAAMLGVFGGGKSRPITVDGAAARFEVTAPQRIRNGEFFEMRIRVTARQAIGKAVLVVPASLWRDMTVNTMIPAPAEEKAEDGAFRFDYGALKPGDVLDIKVDGQINPPLFSGTRGAIELADDQRTLAQIPFAMRVLP